MLIVRPSEIAAVWLGPNTNGTPIVSVTLSSGARLVVECETLEESQANAAALVEAMNSDQDAPVTVGSVS